MPWSISGGILAASVPITRKKRKRRPHFFAPTTINGVFETNPVEVMPMLTQPDKPRARGLLGQARLAKSMGGGSRDPRTHRNAQRFAGASDWLGEGLTLSDDQEIQSHFSAQTLTNASENTQITAQLVRCNPGTLGMTVYLPDLTSWTSEVVVKNGTGYTSTIRVEGFSHAQTIEGRFHESFGEAFGVRRFVPDGNHWVIASPTDLTPLAHASTHQSGGSDAIRLDDLAAPEDNTDLNASTTAHGLLRKLSNSASDFLDGTGAFDTVKITDLASLTGGTLVGRTSLSSGSGQEITLGAGISMSSTTLQLTDAMTAIVASADQDVTNNQNQDSTYFQFSVTAAKWYIVDLLMAISGNNTTGDFEWRFAVAAGTMSGGGNTQSLSGALAVQNVAVTANAAANTANMTVGTQADLEVPIAVRATFAFVPSDTTTFKLQFGNDSAAAGRTSRLKQGSILRYKQMN